MTTEKQSALPPTEQVRIVTRGDGVLALKNLLEIAEWADLEGFPGLVEGQISHARLALVAVEAEEYRAGIAALISGTCVDCGERATKQHPRGSRQILRWVCEECHQEEEATRLG